MNILGISGFYHDSAAALLCDGKLVAAAHEERFTRKRHDPDLPKQATKYCLEAAGIGDRRSRLRRVLRQAVDQARAHADDLPRDLPALAAVLHQGDSGLAQGEALGPEPDPREARLRRRGALRRAPPVARRVGVPALPLRGGGDPHLRRRRGVGDHDPGHRTRRFLRADPTRSASPTRWGCSTAPSPTTWASR